MLQGRGPQNLKTTLSPIDVDGLAIPAMQPQDQPKQHGLHGAKSQKSGVDLLAKRVDFIHDVIEAPNQTAGANQLSNRFFPPGTHKQLRNAAIELNPGP